MIFDVLCSKQAFLDYENIGLKIAKNSHFSNGVSPWFWLKIWNFVNLSFYIKYTEKKVFAYVLFRKQAFLNNKNMDFKKREIGIFPMGIVHEFGQKVEVFFISWVYQK